MLATALLRDKKSLSIRVESPDDIITENQGLMVYGRLTSGVKGQWFLPYANLLGFWTLEGTPSELSHTP